MGEDGSDEPPDVVTLHTGSLSDLLIRVTGGGLLKNGI